jgi:hypothetical protein
MVCAKNLGALAVMAASAAAIKEMQVDLAKEASLYRSGKMHEAIMAKKMVRRCDKTRQGMTF